MFQLFGINGIQDKELITNQQFTSPEIQKLPIKTKCSDLVKIKGFIINKNDIHKLMNEYLEFYFEQTFIKIPFSFLLQINSDIKYFDENYCFINFTHDYFFNHKIQLISMSFSTFSCNFTNMSDYNIEIVLDKYYLDITKRKELATIPFNYNIRNICHYKIPFIEYNDNLHIYKLDTRIELLNQGIFIVKNTNYEIKTISISLNDKISIFNYDYKLLNIYSENMGNLTYYGFNVNEKYDSTNIAGCINFSLFDKITIIITLKSLNVNHENYLDIYMPYWNTIMYKEGLVGLKYV